jgi:hypothetical protein
VTQNKREKAPVSHVGNKMLGALILKQGYFLKEGSP